MSDRSYNEYLRRLASFTGIHLLSNIKPTRYSLAGLYLDGTLSLIRCYACEWEFEYHPEDNVDHLYLHAQSTHRCPHLRTLDKEKTVNAPTPSTVSAVSTNEQVTLESDDAQVSPVERSEYPELSSLIQRMKSRGVSWELPSSVEPFLRPAWTPTQIG